MTKVEWLKKQIKEAGQGLKRELSAPFISKFEEAVAASGDDLTRSEFDRLLEKFKPEDPNELTDYMILNTQLYYCADYSQAWHIPKLATLPTLVAKLEYQGQSLGNDRVQLGGEPDWIQGSNFPPCSGCNANMILLVQIKSLPYEKDLPELDLPDLAGFRFGDGGHVYVFTCPDCGTFEHQMECY